MFISSLIILWKLSKTCSSSSGSGSNQIDTKGNNKNAFGLVDGVGRAPTIHSNIELESDVWSITFVEPYLSCLSSGFL